MASTNESLPDTNKSIDTAFPSPSLLPLPQPQPPGSPSNISKLSYPNSAKLPRRNESIRNTSSSSNTNNGETTYETTEIDLKQILDQLLEVISSTHLSEWFKFTSQQQQNKEEVNFFAQQQRPDSPSSHQLSGSSVAESPPNLFEFIQQALQHIDFNLKRNSDFINELTKLLDTSRAIKQETHLKKMLKLLEDEKNVSANKQQDLGR